MGYCVAADVPLRLPSLKASLAVGSASAADTLAIIEEGIKWADSRIDVKLGKIYTVPFTTVPELIRQISSDLAAYFTARPALAGAGSETADPLALEIYKEAMELLDQLAAGTIEIPGLGPEAEADGASTLAYHTCSPRLALECLPDAGYYYGSDHYRC